MTRIIPRPDVPSRLSRLDLRVSRAFARSDGVRSEDVRFGASWWVGEFVFVAQTDAQMRAMSAFVDELVSGGVVFPAHDTRFERPLLYTDSHSVTGTVSTAHEPNEYTLGGLTQGSELSVGDRIEFRDSENEKNRSLHTIAEVITGKPVSSGGISRVRFVPPVVGEGLGGGASVRLERPSCLMVLEGVPSRPGRRTERRWSFSAEELVPS